jgi:hypothetical protein
MALAIQMLPVYSPMEKTSLPGAVESRATAKLSRLLIDRRGWCR